MLGVHVFQKYKEDKFDDVLFASVLLSVLSWKKFHGPIHLYTNEFFADELKKRGIDKYYEKIDTEFIESRNDRVDIETYWAWNKIRVASKLEPPFVILDNDLWISSKLDFPENKTFVAYHTELVEEESITYPDFDSFLPKDFIGRWKKWIMPVNTALLYIQDRNDFFKNWMNHVRLIAENSPGTEDVKGNFSVKMTFLEQRLLPMLADELAVSYSTFIPHIYNSNRGDANDGSEWTPPVWSWDDELKEKFSKIHHIWGLKNYYEIFEVREYVIKSVLSYLYEYEEINSHEDLVQNLINLIETEKEIDHKN